MSVLSPSNLETTNYGQAGWNAILTANVQRLNTYLTKLWGPTQASVNLGAGTVVNPSALTSAALTDNSGGTPSQTIAFTDLLGVDNNFASVVDEINKLRADVNEIRTALTNLLSALRTTGGCGVLSD